MRASITHLISLLAVTALMVVWAAALGACGSEPSEATGASPSPAPESRAAGGEMMAPAPESDMPPPIVIAHGSPVDLREHLVPGQITLFDFTSEYCHPCRVFAPYLDRLHRERPDITVVKVDINRPGRRGIDWRSPVAQQYRVGSVPHFKLFDAEGNLMAEGVEARPIVIQWITDLPGVQG